MVFGCLPGRQNERKIYYSINSLECCFLTIRLYHYGFSMFDHPGYGGVWISQEKQAIDL